MRVKPYHAWIAFCLRESSNRSDGMCAIAFEYQNKSVLLFQCLANCHCRSFSDAPQVRDRIAGAFGCGQFNPDWLLDGMAFCFQERDKAVIEECLGAVGASPTGDINLIGDADNGDVHSTLSYCMVSCPVLIT